MGRKRKTKNTKLRVPFPFPPSGDRAEAEEARPSQDNGSKAVVARPSWRPPMSVEEDIWKPICVETNGEGKGPPLCGDMLVEVYDVQVHLHEKISGNVHGNVTLNCQCFTPVLFDRDKEHAQMIPDKGSLPLDGPDVAPLGDDPIYISVDLKIDDDELCEGIVRWIPFKHRTNLWLDDEIQGKNGSVLVTYGVMSSACLAELDVKLIESIGTPLRIHGDIVVYINNMQYLRYSVFSKMSHDCSTVKPLDSIPLSRSLFCCPIGSSLVVKVDLWNSDTDDPLAKGALLFPLEYYGELVGTLSGKNANMIEVKVNWLFHRDHPKTKAVLLTGLI